MKTSEALTNNRGCASRQRTDGCKSGRGEAGVENYSRAARNTNDAEPGSTPECGCSSSVLEQAAA